VTPFAGYVVCATREDEKPVFINVTHHSKVPLCYKEEGTVPYDAPRVKTEDSEETELSPLSAVLTGLHKKSKSSPVDEIAETSDAPETDTTVPTTSEDLPPVPFVSITSALEYEDSEGKACVVYDALISSELFNELETPSRKELGSYIAQRINALYDDKLAPYDFQLAKKFSYRGEYPRPDTVTASLKPQLVPDQSSETASSGPKEISGPASVSTVVKQRDFYGWMEVDRVQRGTSAIFSIAVDDECTPDSETEEFERKIILWKVAREEPDEDVTDRRACKVYRTAWTQTMLRQAFLKMNVLGEPISQDALLNAPQYSDRPKVSSTPTPAAKPTGTVFGSVMSMFGYSSAPAPAPAPVPAPTPEVKEVPPSTQAPADDTMAVDPMVKEVKKDVPEGVVEDAKEAPKEKDVSTSTEDSA
jgi:hypothetical protein